MFFKAFFADSEFGKVRDEMPRPIIGDDILGTRPHRSILPRECNKAGHIRWTTVDARFVGDRLQSVSVSSETWAIGSQIADAFPFVARCWDEYAFEVWKEVFNASDAKGADVKVCDFASCFGVIQFVPVVFGAAGVSGTWLFAGDDVGEGVEEVDVWQVLFLCQQPSHTDPGFAEVTSNSGARWERGHWRKVTIVACVFNGCSTSRA